MCSVILDQLLGGFRDEGLGSEDLGCCGKAGPTNLDDTELLFGI